MVRTLRPRMETLEARDCPTVTITTTHGGEVLRIVGDSDWDMVNVVQNDTNDTIMVTASVQAKPGEVVTQVVDLREFQSSTIKRIVVDLQDGNDIFFYGLEGGTDLLFNKSLLVRTGAGDDSVSVNTANSLVYWHEDGEYEGIVPGPSLSSSIRDHLNLRMETGAGNDHVSVDLGHVRDQVQANVKAHLGDGDDTLWLTDTSTVEAGAKLIIDVSGQAGNDSLFAMLYGELAGRVTTTLRGGVGDDVLDASATGLVTGNVLLKSCGGAGNDHLGIDAKTQEGSTGKLCLQVQGNSGDDRITFDAGPRPDQMLTPQTIQLTNCYLNGGAGLDEAFISRRVKTYFVERVADLT